MNVDEKVLNTNTNVFIDVNLDGINWRWSIDCITKERMLFISSELMIMLNNNSIPEELEKEMVERGNGSSVL